MNRCPITYELCGTQKYSQKGLELLSRRMTHLNDFPFTPKEQIQLAAQLAAKLSIQGVQPKLSVILNFAKKQFEIVERGGRFILKPPHQIYDELPQNEDLTMKLAKMVDIEVPLHGMIYNIDGSLSYFIKRFDRLARNQKVGVEDFSQLLGCSRETKYESSMEKVGSVIEKFCTFPAIEKVKLFRRTLFNFLIGNEDMHLKNFMLIRHNNKVELSPAYDLLNTTIVLRGNEEIALPIRGKKSRLTREDIVDYYGSVRLNIPETILKQEMLKIESAIESWNTLIDASFLSEKLRTSYKELIISRWQRISK